MVESMRKSRNRYCLEIFVSCRDACSTIALSVVWIEREFDAYKLSQCMWPCNYCGSWHTARYMWKNLWFYHTALHSMPLLGGFLLEYWRALWDGKTRMVSLRDSENFLKISVFVLTWSTNVTDGWTDRWTTIFIGLHSRMQYLLIYNWQY